MDDYLKKPEIIEKEVDAVSHWFEPVDRAPGDFFDTALLIDKAPSIDASLLADAAMLVDAAMLIDANIRVLHRSNKQHSKFQILSDFVEYKFPITVDIANRLSMDVTHLTPIAVAVVEGDNLYSWAVLSVFDNDTISKYLWRTVGMIDAPTMVTIATLHHGAQR